MARIAVQIPVRDGGDRLARTLDGLRAQDLEAPWELVLADDGSRVPLEEEFDLDFPRRVTVKVVSTGGAGIRAVARNRAWQASEAPVSLLMDADLGVPPDLLRRHLEVRGPRPDAVIMGARIDAWREDANAWQRWFDTRAMGGRPAGPFPWRYLITGNLSMPTELLRRAGGFDENMDFYGGEDTELGFRLDRMGAELHWDPSLRVLHLPRDDARANAEKMLEYGARGIPYLLDRHPEMLGLLGTNWVTGPVRLRDLPMRVAAFLTLRAPVYRAALWWAERFGGPRFIFTYLSVGACLMGYLGRRPL
jgi:glycosyltransferase involved in cell wall biosynthesis